VSCTDIPVLLAQEPREKGCARVAEAKPCGCCELETVAPELSPGPVLADELLARFVSPFHYDAESQTVKSNLFSHAATIGMSVTRIGRASREVDAVSHVGSRYIGYVAAICSDIRSILSNGKRGFAVYDTAQNDNRAHADVCQMVLRPRSYETELRRELQKIFGRFVQIDHSATRSPDTLPS
jgi:hypothetical protein